MDVSEFQNIPAVPRAPQPSTPTIKGVSLKQMRRNRQPHSHLETKSHANESWETWWIINLRAANETDHFQFLKKPWNDWDPSIHHEASHSSFLTQAQVFTLICASWEKYKDLKKDLKGWETTSKATIIILAWACFFYPDLFLSLFLRFRKI